MHKIRFFSAENHRGEKKTNERLSYSIEELRRLYVNIRSGGKKQACYGVIG